MFLNCNILIGRVKLCYVNNMVHELKLKSDNTESLSNNTSM